MKSDKELTSRYCCRYNKDRQRTNITVLLQTQQKELISQVKSDCISIVDREVQDKDAKLLEERISKAKLKEAVSLIRIISRACRDSADDA